MHQCNVEQKKKEDEKKRKKQKEEEDERNTSRLRQIVLWLVLATSVVFGLWMLDKNKTIKIESDMNNAREEKARVVREYNALSQINTDLRGVIESRLFSEKEDVDSMTPFNGRTYDFFPDYDFVPIVPTNSFWMGSDGAEANEAPVHQIVFPDTFYMSKYEVTQLQWFEVMGTRPSHFTGARRPVEQVSWEDIQIFINKLNELKGCTNCYRLPTEAEWEYAARVGSNDIVLSPSRGDSLYSWYLGNSGRQTHEVGTKRANDWGLFDMQGNVWEWVQDEYGSHYYSYLASQGIVSNPQGPDDNYYSFMANESVPSIPEDSDSNLNPRYVIRGGSWFSTTPKLRLTNRSSNVSDTRNNEVGFRLIMNRKAID